MRLVRLRKMERKNGKIMIYYVNQKKSTVPSFVNIQIYLNTCWPWLRMPIRCPYTCLFIPCRVLSKPLTVLIMQSDHKELEKTDSGSLTKSDTSPTSLGEKIETVVYPEGGVSGWATVIGATLLQYCTYGYTNAFGVYQDFYSREYLNHYSPSAIGWIGGVQIFLTLSLGIFTGRAFDRGYFHHLIISGSVLHAIALFMLSLSHENSYYQVFLTQGLCLGISCGLTLIPSLAIASHHFKRHLPLAMGIVSAGAALGAVIHPIMLNKIFAGSLGFHNGVRVSAAVNIVILIIANLLMRTRLPPKKVDPILPLAMKFMRDIPYLTLVIGIVLSVCGLFFPIFDIQLDAVLHNVDQNLAYYSLSVLNAASIVGRIVPSIFAPKLGILNMYIFFNFGMAGVMFSMIAVKDLAGTMIFSVFYGFFSGAVVGLTAPALGVLSRDEAELGVRLGVPYALCGIIALFASPISGALLTRDYHWIRAILFAGITMIVSSCFCIVPRMYVARRRGLQLV